MTIGVHHHDADNCDIIGPILLSNLNSILWLQTSDQVKGEIPRQERGTSGSLERLAQNQLWVESQTIQQVRVSSRLGQAEPRINRPETLCTAHKSCARLHHRRRARHVESARASGGGGSSSSGSGRRRRRRRAVGRRVGGGRGVASLKFTLGSMAGGTFRYESDRNHHIPPRQNTSVAPDTLSSTVGPSGN